jgi:hypothetical protein
MVTSINSYKYLLYQMMINYTVPTVQEMSLQFYSLCFIGFFKEIVVGVPPFN